ncbi:MAG: VOC family protein [Rhizobiaceae bacterium]
MINSFHCLGRNTSIIPDKVFELTVSASEVSQAPCFSLASRLLLPKDHQATCLNASITLTKPSQLPEGYHSVTPYMTVGDADLLIAFLLAAFEASIVKEDRNDRGRVMHARLRIGDSIIMMNEATESYSQNVSQLHLFVEDADVTYERALGLGAESIMKPNDRPHGDRMAGIKDPTGNIWWIATNRL